MCYWCNLEKPRTDGLASQHRYCWGKQPDISPDSQSKKEKMDREQHICRSSYQHNCQKDISSSIFELCFKRSWFERLDN